MFRLDRFLTLYFFHPLAKHRRLSSEHKVPILMYHGISGLQKKGSHPYYETSTSPGVFARQMGFLKESGYRVIGLSDIKSIFSNSGNRGEKQVAITFDDGLADFHANAFPILNQYRYPATVYLPAGLMGHRVNGQACMTWAQVRDLAAKKIAFGSHSLTHPMLVDLGPAELEREIRHSKDRIESELGQQIDSFSYPYAFPEHNGGFLKRYSNLLETSGYRIGVTTIIGTAVTRDNCLFLKRLPGNDYDDLQFFAAKLEGAYDWLHLGQIIFKKTIEFARINRVLGV